VAILSMIKAEQVKELRNETGVSVMLCKKALEEAGGDPGKAKAILKSQGAKLSAKKADRALGSGVVHAYVHANKAVGAMIVLSCETDFVAKNDEFIALAYDIAMQVTATDPECISRKAGEKAGADGVLLEQKFIKDPELTIQGLLDEAVTKFGERIEITQITRIRV
jgi:elongation factor Ts